MNRIAVLALILTTLFFTGCQQAMTSQAPAVEKTGEATIFLYGESHGNAKIMAKELELWKDYYTNQGMRHLFVELPYYTAEWMNLWMKEKDDAILYALHEDSKGTASHNQATLDFFMAIKKECPETIFHGTDVGHQHETTGKRYLAYLENQNQKESEAYKRTLEVIEQGQYFYGHSDDEYRENKMTENFIWALKPLKNEKIMGIYGGAHTGLDSMNFTGKVPSMANQINKSIKEKIYSENLASYALLTEPIRVESITVKGKSYEAAYFGKHEINIQNYKWREVWRLEKAYDDFKEAKTNDDVLPYDNYPMVIEKGQVFVIDYETTDGKVERMYYRSDGLVWQNRPSTTGFKGE